MISLNSIKKPSFSEGLVRGRQAAFERLCHYLNRLEVPFQVLEPYQTVDFKVALQEQEAWHCILSLYPNSGLVCYSCWPQSIEQPFRSKVALFLTLLNNEEFFGNFEMDLKTGDLRFKTYTACDWPELNEGRMERTLIQNLETMRQRLPLLRSFLAQA